MTKVFFGFLTVFCLFGFQNCAPASFSSNASVQQSKSDDTGSSPSTPSTLPIPGANLPTGAVSLYQACDSGLAKARALTSANSIDLADSNAPISLSAMAEASYVADEYHQGSIDLSGSSKLFMRAGLVDASINLSGNSELYLSIGDGENLTASSGSIRTCIEALRAYDGVSSGSGDIQLFVRGTNPGEPLGNSNWNTSFSGNSNVYIENAVIGELNVSGDANIVLKDVSVTNLVASGHSHILLIHSKVDSTSVSDSPTIVSQ